MRVQAIRALDGHGELLAPGVQERPRARLAVGGDGRRQHGGAELGQRLQAVAGGLGAIDLEQDLAQLVVDRDGCIGGGIDATGDAGLDLAEGDLVADQDGCLQAGAAGLLHVVGRRIRRKRRGQQRLARQVEISRMLEHRAGGGFAQTLAGDAGAVDEALHGGRQHVLV